MVPGARKEATAVNGPLSSLRVVLAGFLLLVVWGSAESLDGPSPGSRVDHAIVQAWLPGDPPAGFLIERRGVGAARRGLPAPARPGAPALSRPRGPRLRHDVPVPPEAARQAGRRHGRLRHRRVRAAGRPPAHAGVRKAPAGGDGRRHPAGEPDKSATLPAAVFSSGLEAGRLVLGAASFPAGRAGRPSAPGLGSAPDLAHLGQDLGGPRQRHPSWWARSGAVTWAWSALAPAWCRSIGASWTAAPVTPVGR